MFYKGWVIAIGYLLALTCNFILERLEEEYNREKTGLELNNILTEIKKSLSNVKEDTSEIIGKISDLEDRGGFSKGGPGGSEGSTREDMKDGGLMEPCSLDKGDEGVRDRIEYGPEGTSATGTPPGEIEGEIGTSGAGTGKSLEGEIGEGTSGLLGGPESGVEGGILDMMGSIIEIIQIWMMMPGGICITMGIIGGLYWGFTWVFNWVKNKFKG